ncbi:MAG: helicase-related protein, partial [Candidatus Sericytochromatia bacterium]
MVSVTFTRIHFFRKTPADKLYQIGLRFGLGIHHNSIPEEDQREVERLFRMKRLKVCFATGTLAFGISMPCRTVVMADESNYLNTVTFFQCAGRSGRRGFDA